VAYLVLMTEQEIERSEVQGIVNQAGGLSVGQDLHYMPASREGMEDEDLLKSISVMQHWPFPRTLRKVTGQTTKAGKWCLWIVNP